MKAVTITLSLLLVSACAKGAHEREEELESATNAAQGSADNRIDCAIGSTAYEPRCTVEQVRDEAGLALVLRAPDGSFRRLRVTDDGRGVIAADGSQPAEVRPLNDGLIEVRIGGDRYRLPATVRPPEQ
jgi:hypothetical protein